MDSVKRARFCVLGKIGIVGLCHLQLVKGF